MNVEIAVKNEYSVDIDDVKSLAKTTGLNEKFVELLCRRGVSTEEEINRFLHPDENDFYDPFLLKGMREAVDRLNAAIERKEKIVVYGDYDADGVCAAAILSLFLSGRGLNVLVHIPNRVGEGYGLNIDSLGRIIENELPDLILTCDCGISGAEEVRFATELGVDVIVTDHHEISGEIPDCVVINPKQPDCSYPYDMLCGAGVALKLVEALSDRKTMLEYTDLACVATIADLVPLLDENRIIVQVGLKRVNERKNIGLRVMFDFLRLNDLSSGDVAFKIAPRINAAGRMGDAFRAFELLTTTNISRASAIVGELEADNARRKEICDEMYEEAVADLAFEDTVNSRAIVLSHPDWEKGITGILAARLAGDYNRPAFILVKSGDAYKGTCRSVEGVNIHELLTYCRDELIEFGGHSQAAGFSLAPDKKEAFAAKANEFLKRYDDDLFFPCFRYDMELDEPTVDFVKSLDLLEPTGNGNQRPLFKLTATDLIVSPCKNNPAHISVILPNCGLQMFAFNYSKLAYQLMSPGKKELVAELQMSTYGGGKQIKGVIKTVKPENLYINDASAAGYEYGLLRYLPKNGAKYRSYEQSELDSLEIKPYGTLFIAFRRDSYERFAAKKSELRVHEFNYATTQNNFSRIIVAPELDGLPLSGYERIFFLDKPINLGVVSYLNSKTKAEILLPSGSSGGYAVSTERAVMTSYYELIKRNRTVTASSAFAWFRSVSRSERVDFAQLEFCFAVFEELGFIKLSREPFSVTINSGVRADLETSVVYSAAKEGNDA